MQLGRLVTSLGQRWTRARGEKPRVRIRIMLSRPGVPGRRYHKPKEPRTGVPRRGLCRPKCPTRRPKGWHHRRLDILGAGRADSRVFCQRAKRARGENPGFGFASCSRGLVFPQGNTTGRNADAVCSRTGTLQAQIPTLRLTFLPNTQQTKWCCSGSPHPIFHLGLLRRLSWTTCHILARSSTRRPKKSLFFKTTQQWSSSYPRLAQAHTNASTGACATSTPLLETGRSKTRCYLAPKTNSNAEFRHEQTPFEPWKQDFVF